MISADLAKRLANALGRIVRREDQKKYTYGLMGMSTPAGPVFVAPGGRNFVWVKIRVAAGAQTTVKARNDARVEHSENLSVRMYKDRDGHYVIDSVYGGGGLATVPPSDPSGVPPHIHDDRYFRENEHLNASAGVASASKPIVLDAGGLLSNTFLDAELAAIAGLVSAADRLPYFTGLGTASLTAFTAFARTFLDDADAVTVRATLGLIIGTNVQAQDAELQAIAGLASAADRLPYFTGSGTASLATFTAYGRTLAALADAAALRTSAGLVAGGAGDIWVEKAGDTMSGALNMGAQLISGVLDPVSSQDAATKAYVDALALGLDLKASVRAATTANITLSGAQTIDGVSVIAGDRVLVKDQTAPAENGIYVAAAGAWARAADANVSAEVTAGLYTFVSEGTLYADNGFALTTNDPIVLGTTALVFTQVSGAGQIVAGAALGKTGNQLDVQVDNSSVVIVADALQAGPTLVGDRIHAATDKATPVDADELGIADSAASWVLKKLTWANLKATIQTFLDAIYVIAGGKAGGQSVHGGNAANEDYTIRGTAHATKTTSYVLIQPDGGFVGIGPIAAPTNRLYVEETTADTNPATFAFTATASNPPRGNVFHNRDQSALSAGGLRFTLTDSVGTTRGGAGILVGKEQLYDGAVSASWDAYLAFMVSQNGTLVEYGRFSSAGVLSVQQIIKALGNSGLLFQDDAGNFGAAVFDGGGFTRFANSGKGEILYETIAVANIAMQLAMTRAAGSTAVGAFWAKVFMAGRIGTAVHGGCFEFFVSGRSSATILFGNGANQNITVTVVTQTSTNLTLKFAVTGAAGTWAEFSGSIVAMSPVDGDWTFTGSQVA